MTERACCSESTLNDNATRNKQASKQEQRENGSKTTTATESIATALSSLHFNLRAKAISNRCFQQKLATGHLLKPRVHVA
jgi:hypothetical protein